MPLSKRKHGEGPLGAFLHIAWPAGSNIFELEQAELVLGRSPSSDIVIDSPAVSRVHARLVREGATYRYVQVGSSSPTFVNGRRATDRLLRSGDRLEIARGTALAVTLIFVRRPTAVGPKTRYERKPRLAAAPAVTGIDVNSADGAGILIGRAPTSSIVLDDLRVSRQHARVMCIDAEVQIEDLHSTNGVFVNGERISKRALRSDDLIRIGPYRLIYDGTAIQSYDDGLKVRIDAFGLHRKIGAKVVLDDVSLSVLPGQRFAIAGTSGAGKSTLMDALNGVRRPDSGRVRINGTDLYESYESVQSLFGYTPQQDIVHPELSVERALMYSARLRLPSDVSQSEMHDRVESVLDELGLAPVRQLEIRKLSGGQLKRVSIASELLANPGLLFLDEPTSGLDPGLTLRLMEVVNELADGGHTVILVTHDVSSLSQCDRMIFLASGGRTAFIGSPSEALEYFEVTELATIYTRVENEETPEWWQERFRRSALGRRELPPEPDTAAPSRWDTARLAGVQGGQRKSFMSQFRVLIQRRAEILFRDRRNLALLLLQAPAIGLLLALVFGSNALAEFGALADPSEGAKIGASVPRGALASALPLILAATATWFGAINAAREIVRELPVFARERQAGMRVLPYMASKMAILSLLAALQVAMLLGVLMLKVDVPKRGVFTYAAIEIYATLLLAAIAAEALGLLISAAVSNADRAQSLVPLVLIPQIIFVGGPLASTFSYGVSAVTVTRWAIEGIKIAIDVPYRGASGFERADLVLRWSVLAGELAAFFALATTLVHNKKAKPS